MADIAKLKFSLTKFGAHKLVDLLKTYDKDQVLAHLGDTPGDKIDAPSARAILSADPKGTVPALWNNARALGNDAIKTLVFLGLVFSHHRLIGAMQAGRKGRFKGVIKRGAVVDAKEFTNFKRELIDMGYGSLGTPKQVSYNIEPLFAPANVHPLALDLLTRKLKLAGWAGVGSPIDALVAADFHESLAISADQFRNWLSTGSLRATARTLEDSEYFADAAEDEGQQVPFRFKPGHTPKKTGLVAVAAPVQSSQADLLHNMLQTALFDQLAAEHGRECVGTEQQTGHGTSIDLVVKTKTFCWFYEIKVADTVKACIRQAIPQLLEYAYWRKDSNVAERLIIASQFKLTKDAKEFIDLLNKRFALPFYYVQIVI
jgi:hypothetical protein